MVDRSPRGRAAARPRPRRSWCARSCGCGGATGSGRCRSPASSACRPRPCTRCWSAAGSTGSSHRPGHRRADPPLRTRPPRLADPRRCHQVRQHPRRRRLALRRQTARRPQPHITRRPHRQRAARTTTRSSAPRFVHTVIDDHSRVAYAEICADEKADTAIGVLQRAVAWFAERGVTVERVLSDNGCCLPLLRLARRLHRHSASPTNEPGPTGPRPTARSNASTAPWPTAGPTPASTTQKPPAEKPCPHGCTSTITTEPTAPSEAYRRSAA